MGVGEGEEGGGELAFTFEGKVFSVSATLALYFWGRLLHFLSIEIIDNYICL